MTYPLLVEDGARMLFKRHWMRRRTTVTSETCSRNGSSNDKYTQGLLSASKMHIHRREFIGSSQGQKVLYLQPSH